MHSENSQSPAGAAFDELSTAMGALENDDVLKSELDAAHAQLITYRPKTGEALLACCQNAKSIADGIHRNVEFEFNGTKEIVSPNMDVGRIIDNWMKARERKEQCDKIRRDVLVERLIHENEELKRNSQEEAEYLAKSAPADCVVESRLATISNWRQKYQNLLDGLLDCDLGTMPRCMSRNLSTKQQQQIHDLVNEWGTAYVLQTDDAGSIVVVHPSRIVIHTP